MFFVEWDDNESMKDTKNHTETTTLDFHLAAAFGRRIGRFFDDYMSVWGPTVHEAWANSKNPTPRQSLLPN